MLNSDQENTTDSRWSHHEISTSTKRERKKNIEEIQSDKAKNLENGLCLLITKNYRNCIILFDSKLRQSWFQLRLVFFSTDFFFILFYSYILQLKKKKIQELDLFTTEQVDFQQVDKNCFWFSFRFIYREML